MNATTTKQYNTVLSQAKRGVPGFALAYGKFIEKVTIGQNSKSLIVNYSRSLVFAVFIGVSLLYYLRCGKSSTVFPTVQESRHGGKKSS